MFELSKASEIPDITESLHEVNDYRCIKPEEGISFHEAQSFWDNIFSQELHVDENDKMDVEQKNCHKEIRDGKELYYDDNGNLYRVDKELLPDHEYEINGYRYKTDRNGRIISAEGILHLKTHEGKLPIKDSLDDIGKGDEKEGDDRGHLIGDQFDGSNGLENMIPQDAKINQGDFKKFENELAKEVKEGKEIYYTVEPIYEGDSRRPSMIVVTYNIDKVENIRFFPNGKGDNS